MIDIYSLWRACLATMLFGTLACGSDDANDDGGDTAADSTGQPATTAPAEGSGGTTASAETSGGPASTGVAESSGGVDSTGAPACMTDVCTTYGAAVPAVAGQIVDQAAADPQFMAFFAPLVAEGPQAVMDFKTSLANFITDAYGCTTGAYTGPTMEMAHMGMGITQEQYDAFIGLIAGVLTTNGVPEADVNDCFAPPLVDPAFVATIVGQ